MFLVAKRDYNHIGRRRKIVNGTWQHQIIAAGTFERKFLLLILRLHQQGKSADPKIRWPVLIWIAAPFGGWGAITKTAPYSWEQEQYWELNNRRHRDRKSYYMIRNSLKWFITIFGKEDAHAPNIFINRPLSHATSVLSLRAHYKKSPCYLIDEEPQMKSRLFLRHFLLVSLRWERCMRRREGSNIKLS